MARPMFPWLRLRKKTDPELPLEPPILLGNKSNGEFFHEQTPLERRIRKEILRQADEKARYIGVDRRDFLASAMGMATSLAVLNMASGCGGEDGTSGKGTGAGGSGGGGAGGSGGGSGGGPSDGGFDVRREATLDCGVAAEALSGDEFILDLQTHHMIDEALWKERRGADKPYPPGAISFVPDCKTIECIDQNAYVDRIFLNSDTTVAVLSGFPSAICDEGDLCTSKLSNQDMVLTRDWINEAAGSQRVVQHCQVAPNDRWDVQSAMMERIRSEWGNNGWKCYPPWGPSLKADGSSLEGWLLDDAVGTRFIDRCVDLGEPLICIHKGFLFPMWDPIGADPAEVGTIAKQYPNVHFVIYHSAFEPSKGLRQYPDAGPWTGTDRLAKTVLDNGLKGKNVYAEMGSAWALVMNSTTSAQHYVGKMLKYLGEDNLVWGSECTWFGSPQPQIEAFRKLTISKQFQDLYGYPALTPEIKKKILGLNAAKIYGINPDELRCKVNTDKLAQLKRDLDGEFGARRWAFQGPDGPRTRREFLQLGRLRQARGEPA